jgi:hypothetical protein
MVPGGGQSTVAARQMVGVSGHAGDAPALAPLDGREALDLCATAWLWFAKNESALLDAAVGDRRPGADFVAVPDRAQCDGFLPDRIVDNDIRQWIGRQTRPPPSAYGQVLRLRGLPFVAMMKPADFRNRDDRHSGWW